MDHMMNSLAGMVKPITDWAIDQVTENGRRGETPLAKAAAPFLASRAIVVINASIITMAYASACPLLAVASFAAAVYASIDFARLAVYIGNASDTGGAGILGAGAFHLSLANYSAENWLRRTFPFLR
jgi:hypothetical protein